MNIKKSPSNMLVTLAIICSFLGSGISLGTIFGFAILPIRIVGIACALWLLIMCFSDTDCRLKTQYVLAAYVYMLIMTLLFTENHFNSVSLLLDYLCLFSVFCVVFLKTNSEYSYKNYVNIYLICILITIIICFYEYLTQHHIARNYTQAYSTSDWAYLYTIKAPTAFLYNPNNVAVLMIIALPLLFEKITDQGETIKKIVWIAVTILDIAVIFMTGSRGGFLAGTVMVVVFFLTSNLKMWKKALLIGLGIALMAYFSTFIFNQLGYGGMLKNGTFSLFAEGDGGRSNIAKSAIENVFINNPIFGSGAGALENHNLTSAHNTIIEVLCNYGIIGMFIFCFLIVRLLKRLLSQDGKIISILLAMGFFMSMFIPPTIMTIYVLFIPLALRAGRSFVERKVNNECINYYK